MTLFEKQILNGFFVVMLTACSTAPAISPENMASIIQALEESTAAKTATPDLDVPPEVTAALLPQISNGSVSLVPEIEQRFDVSVKAAEAPKFFL